MKSAKIPDCTLLPAAGARAAANARGPPASESPLLPLPVRPRFPRRCWCPRCSWHLRHCRCHCRRAVGPLATAATGVRAPSAPAPSWLLLEPELRLALPASPGPLPVRRRLSRPPARLLVPVLQLALASQPWPLPVRRRPPATLQVAASPFAPAPLPLPARLSPLLIVSVPLAVVAGCPPTRLSF